MDKELQAGLVGLDVEWHTRQGAPHSVADLEHVAAGLASTIVLLNPTGTTVGLCWV
jgi:hypothetical protein